MANVTIKNLSRKEALELLNNVQKNACRGIAIQGPNTSKWVATYTVMATVKPQENEFGDVDFSKNTFEIYSNYWQESTLREYAEIND